MQINLDEATAYLRELLLMSRDDLLRELGPVAAKSVDKKARVRQIVSLVFEHKFDPNTRVSQHANDQFNPG